MSFEFSDTNYNKLLKLHRDVLEISHKDARILVTKLWKQAKNDKSVDLAEKMAELSRSLRDKQRAADAKKASKTISFFFDKQAKQKKNSENCENSETSNANNNNSSTVNANLANQAESSEPESQGTSNTSSSNEPEPPKPDAPSTSSGTKSTSTPQVKKTNHPTPKQDALRKEICDLTENIAGLECLVVRSEVQNKMLSKLRKQLSDANKLLKKKKDSATRQQKHRFKNRDTLKRLAESGNEEAKKLCHENPGRPQKIDNEALIKTLQDIACTAFIGAHDRRRTELIKTVKTLDDLTEACREAGFDLSRSSVYLRILPRNASTTEGKRHVNTVSYF